MDLLLWAEDSEPELFSELKCSIPRAPLHSLHSGWVETDLRAVPGRRLPCLAFVRQWLPNARPLRAESINAWAAAVFGTLADALPDQQPWSLQVEPHYGAPATHRMGARAWHSRTRLKLPPDQTAAARGPALAAGRHRSRLIREAVLELLQKKRRHLLRQLRRELVPFTPLDSSVQVLLTAPDAGFISVAPAPLPFEQRHLLSHFPKGEVPAAVDKAAPSRAFAKLVEAELRLGRAVHAGETCVDLGASPGSWSYVALKRGARVLVVDRSPLREDLMAHPRVRFQRGDAFRFQPERPVDWLLCDVIAAPERNAELLLEWLRRGWCRFFVVTLKLKDSADSEILARLKQELPSLTCEHFLLRLCANKKEICAFGERKQI